MTENESPPPGARAMAVVRWLLVALMAAAAVASLTYYLRSRAPSVAAARDVWTCPMHPGVQQDHPGECPICSMTLVKKEKGQPAAPVPSPTPGAAAPPGLVPIDLTPDRIQLTGIRTAPAARESLAAEIHTVGFVAASEKGLAQVQTRIPGWIQRLAVAQTGAKVQKGQVVAWIYSPDLVAAQQELLNAVRWQRDGSSAAPTAADARARLELLGIDVEDIAAIERAGQPIRDLQVRSRVAGFVTRKNAVEGLFVQPGTVLYELADLSTVWVLADVYEYEIERVRAGQEATVRLAAFPRATIRGKVTFLAPDLDPATRTLRVRIELPNADSRLRPGMYGDVSIAGDRTDGVFVPAEAVVDTGEAQYVFLAQAGGRFEPRRVKVGARAGDKVQILEGVSEGETVVTTANFLLDSESRLRATVQEAR
jgi:membrane fusion protein, copper/silver efflux system